MNAEAAIMFVTGFIIARAKMDLLGMDTRAQVK